MTGAGFLFSQFSEAGDIGPVGDYVTSKLPAVEYESIELSRLPLDNKAGKSVERSIVWYPAGQLEAVRKIKFTILADSPDCTFYLLRLASGLSFKLKGPASTALNLCGGRFAMSIRMGGDNGASPASRAIIGEHSFCAGAAAILINTTLRIKKNALMSDGILLQGSNQHGLVDIETRTLIECRRNYITLEPHVWIGRRAILCAGAHIGEGSIVATGGLVANNVPQTCIVGGNPAKVIKRNRTWSDSMYAISKMESAMIEGYEVCSPRRVIDWLLAKAAAAGFIGALLFEGVLELL